MKKKLQVFISSTFTDLVDERQAAVQAILDAGHIPAGMELFKAGNRSQLETIKKWIDESDVYMLILGGRYGSIEPSTELSYTQIEYEYAIGRKMPVFAVILGDKYLERNASERPDTEIIESSNPDKYERFKKLVMSKIIRKVDDCKDIKITVLSTLSEFMDEYDLTGWVKTERNEKIVTEKKDTIVCHKCIKCAKEEWLPSDLDIHDANHMDFVIKKDKWHLVYMETPGYGSKYDMCDLNFELCDECLDEIIEGFVLKDQITDTY